MRESFTDIIKLYESGMLEQTKKQDAPLSIKLVPNSERTRIEKATFAKDLKLAKLEHMMEADSDDLSSSMSFEHCAGELKDRDLLPAVAYYFESVFGLREIYLFRGIISVYLGLYLEAIADFEH